MNRDNITINKLLPSQSREREREKDRDRDRDRSVSKSSNKDKYYRERSRDNDKYKSYNENTPSREKYSDSKQKDKYSKRDFDRSSVHSNISVNNNREKDRSLSRRPSMSKERTVNSSSSKMRSVSSSVDRNGQKKLRSSATTEGINVTPQGEVDVTLDKSKYGRLLGEGRVAKVYQVVGREFQAAKRHTKDHDKYYRNEKEILSKIQDLGVTPQIYKFDDEDRAIYMEKGRCSLYTINRDRIKKKQAWTQKEIYQIIKTLYKFVKKLSKVDVYHNEIRIDNILVMDNDTDIKLIDFGCSTLGFKNNWKVSQQQNEKETLTDQQLKEQCIISEIKQIFKLGQLLMCNIVAYQEEQNQKQIYQHPNQQKEQIQAKDQISQFYPNLVEILKSSKIEIQNGSHANIEKIINKAQFQIVNFDRIMKKKVNPVILEAKKKEELSRKKLESTIEPNLDKEELKRQEEEANFLKLKDNRVQVKKAGEQDGTGEGITQLVIPEANNKTLKRNAQTDENALEEGEVIEKKRVLPANSEEKRTIAKQHKSIWLRRLKEREEQKKKELEIIRKEHKKRLLQDGRSKSKSKRKSSRKESKSRSKSRSKKSSSSKKKSRSGTSSRSRRRRVHEKMQQILHNEAPDPLQIDLKVQMGTYEKTFEEILEIEKKIHKIRGYVFEESQKEETKSCYELNIITQQEKVMKETIQMVNNTDFIEQKQEDDDDCSEFIKNYKIAQKLYKNQNQIVQEQIVKQNQILNQNWQYRSQLAGKENYCQVNYIPWQQDELADLKQVNENIQKQHKMIDQNALQSNLENQVELYTQNIDSQYQVKLEEMDQQERNYNKLIQKQQEYKIREQQKLLQKQKNELQKKIEMEEEEERRKKETVYNPFDLNNLMDDGYYIKKQKEIEEENKQQREQIIINPFASETEKFQQVKDQIKKLKQLEQQKKQEQILKKQEKEKEQIQIQEEIEQKQIQEQKLQLKKQNQKLNEEKIQKDENVKVIEIDQENEPNNELKNEIKEKKQTKDEAKEEKKIQIEKQYQEEIQNEMFELPELDRLEGEPNYQYMERWIVYRKAYKDLKNYNRALNISLLYGNINFHGVRYALPVTEQLQKYMPVYDELEEKNRKKKEKKEKKKKKEKESYNQRKEDYYSNTHHHEERHINIQTGDIRKYVNV